MLMAKGHLLFARNILIGGVRRPIHRIDQAKKTKEAKEQQHQGGPGETVAALTKDLRHGRTVLKNGSRQG